MDLIANSEDPISRFRFLRFPNKSNYNEFHSLDQIRFCHCLSRMRLNPIKVLFFQPYSPYFLLLVYYIKRGSYTFSNNGTIYVEVDIVVGSFMGQDYRTI